MRVLVWPLMACLLFLTISSDAFVAPIGTNTMVCACAKCGSTSLWVWIYEILFGTPWPFIDAPYIYEIYSPRWHGKLKFLLEHADQDAIFKGGYTFAFVRDPKERTISAWKSKATCKDKLYGTDVNDREKFVGSLLDLAGISANESTAYVDHHHGGRCLSLHNYIRLLYKANMRGQMNQHSVDDHIKPQRYACFRRYKPDKWTGVLDIAGANMTELAFRLGNSSMASKFPHYHSSTGAKAVKLSAEDDAMLDLYLKEEYAILSPFLLKAKENAARLLSLAGI